MAEHKSVTSVLCDSGLGGKGMAREGNTSVPERRRRMTGRAGTSSTHTFLVLMSFHCDSATACCRRPMPMSRVLW